MGELAKTLVSLSGPSSVHGIIPKALIKTEKGYDGTPVGEAGKSKEAEKTVSREEMEEMDSHKHGTPSQLNEGSLGKRP